MDLNGKSDEEKKRTLGRMMESLSLMWLCEGGWFTVLGLIAWLHPTSPDSVVWGTFALAAASGSFFRASHWFQQAREYLGDEP